MDFNTKAEKLNTDKAPSAVGPYSQAVKFANMVFCSGQIGIDPLTNELVGDDIAEQTRRVLTNLQEVLAVAGTDLSKVVQTTIYITDMNKYSEVNNVYGEFFNGEPLPARATVGVSSLPKRALVEISCIAYI